LSDHRYLHSFPTRRSSDLIIIIYLLVRKVLTFNECMECFPKGFKAMVPAILILTFAWTLSGVTSLLGAKEYVSSIFKGGAANLLDRKSTRLNSSHVKISYA